MRARPVLFSVVATAIVAAVVIPLSLWLDGVIAARRWSDGEAMAVTAGVGLAFGVGVLIALLVVLEKIGPRWFE